MKRNIYPWICPKCGLIAEDGSLEPNIKSDKTCELCQEPLISMDHTEAYYLDTIKPGGTQDLDPNRPCDYYGWYRNDATEIYFKENNLELDPELYKQVRKLNHEKETEWQIAINEEAAIPKCPRCRSKAITTQTKGFRAGKAGLGFLAAGPVGVAAGAIGSGKVINLCANCGYKWEPGK